MDPQTEITSVSKYSIFLCAGATSGVQRNSHILYTPDDASTDDADDGSTKYTDYFKTSCLIF